MNRIALVGGLIVWLVSCGQAEEPGPAQSPPAPPVVEFQIDEHQLAMGVLERRLGEVRGRLGQGQRAAGSRNLEIQAAWSVSLRELGLQLDEIAARLHKLRKRRDQPWKAERDEIEKATDDLDRQFLAELEALGRYR